jgi:putative intracellular protease/amidase
MQRTPVHLLIFDGFADWEPALACAEINKSPGFAVRTVGFSTSPVLSMAGLKVTPDLSLRDVDARSSAMLILPGGDMWEAGERSEVTDMIGQFRNANAPVAVICAGTLAAAHANLLNSREHTSNFDGYLAQHAPSYAGKSYYRQVSAITDDGVISESGMGSVDFAYEILKQLRLYSDQDLGIWSSIFKDKVMPPELIP